MNRNWKSEIEPDFNEALRLFHEEGRAKEALEILSRIAELHPNFPAVFGVMGGIYKLTGDLRNAARYFRRVIELNPKSELASRGLFMSLYRVGRKDEAWAEARRFLSIAESKEYVRMIHEINTAHASQSTGVKLGTMPNDN